MIKKIMQQFQDRVYLKIDKEDLDSLAKSAKVCEEHDTLISDYLRILQIDNNFLIQETSSQGEILLRRFDSLESAQKFVNSRMIIYDKMWDGCGCKVDYYS